MKNTGSGNIPLLLASVAVTLLLAEAVLRIFIPANIGTTWEFRVPHQEYGWVLEPGIRYHYRMPEEMVAVEHNSIGFHDTEHSYTNDSGRQRAVLLGDSFIEAYSVELEDTLHKQLENLASQAGKHVEVISLGVGGYGTLQEYLVYMNEGRKYGPDHVLLGFYVGNDLRNNSYELESLVNAGHMKTLSRPFLDIDRPGDFTITRVDFDGAMRRYEQALEERNTSWHRLTRASSILKAVDMILERVFPETQKNSPAVSQEDRDFTMLGMHLCDEAAEFTRSWEITRRILARLNEEVRASGANLVIFSVPARHEVDTDVGNALTAGFHAPGSLCLEQAPAYQRLEQLTGELGIEYVDLLPAFRQASSEGVTLFRSDRHWNAAGHAIAAKKLAGYFD